LPWYRNPQRADPEGNFLIQEQETGCRHEASAGSSQALGVSPTEDQMLRKDSNMPLLSFHALAATRGDGLRPEFVDLFKRLAAGADATLSESTQPPAGLTFEPVKDDPTSKG
jgi:hypothetical protein